jgi:GNAT superfamily N-acetyltransferase
MTIVKLSRESVDKIYNLYKDDFKDGWTKEMLASAFETGRFNVYGAEIEKCLVGIISFSVTIDTADLEDVFVLPSFRRKKIADDLFNAMEENLSALNVQKLFLLPPATLIFSTI